MKRARAPIFLLLFCGACAPATRHKVMTFLFDGAPAPHEAADAPASASEAAPAAGDPAVPAPAPAPGAGTGVVHPPYEAKACDSCHDAASPGAFTTALPDLCFTCHQAPDEKATSVHWPVKQGRCASCHDPHQSAHTKLLRKPVPRLCFDCHGETRLAHGPDMGLCTDCHDPHSAAQPSLMK